MVVVTWLSFVLVIELKMELAAILSVKIVDRMFDVMRFGLRYHSI